MMPCELCQSSDETVLFQDDKLRVILVADAQYPGFCRVIWREHVKEMSDLDPSAQQHLFAWLLKTEQAVRTVMQPDKINLASLGNMVPHLHWHVIPRFVDDAHFPAPIWATARHHHPRAAPPALAAKLQAALLA